uniref:Uncharacterized protein n=1 Tax=Anguilla anguilla TaxID=7936 RepID=A0A0E9VFK1_ANGAN
MDAANETLSAGQQHCNTC